MHGRDSGCDFEKPPPVLPHPLGGRSSYGAVEVALVATDSGGLQFIERFGSGALHITAIDINGNAVHSRHTVGFDGVLSGAQYYGKCRRL